MLISVIIPTYKPGNYIIECLKSLANQTLSPNCFEIIIVLNGCREPYEEFVKKNILNILQGINVTLLQIDEAGVSNARNKGLDKAEGEYICFIDDDDIVSSNYLAALLSKSDKGTLVVSDVKTFISDISQSSDDYISNVFMKFKSKDKNSIFLKRSFLSTVWCKIIPKNLIGNFRFNVRFKIGEDALFMFSISKGVKKIVLSDEAIYYRRCRIGSASRVKQSIIFKLRNSLMQISQYTQIYFRNPFEYNFFLFFSRIVASVIHIVK